MKKTSSVPAENVSLRLVPKPSKFQRPVLPRELIETVDRNKVPSPLNRSSVTISPARKGEPFTLSVKNSLPDQDLVRRLVRLLRLVGDELSEHDEIRVRARTTSIATALEYFIISNILWW
jgi:hypothetical protein